MKAQNLTAADKDWNEHFLNAQIDRDLLLFRFPEGKINIHRSNCRNGCLSCPHPIFVLPSKKRLSRPSSKDLIAEKLWDTKYYIPSIKDIVFAEERILASTKIAKAALENSLKLAQECVNATERWNGKPIKEIVTLSVEHQVVGPYCPLPYLSIAIARYIIDFLLLRIKAAVTRFNDFDNLTKYGKSREGQLNIYIRNQTKYQPLIGEWRIYLKNKDGAWFSVRSGNRTGKKPLNLAGMKRLTRKVVFATGNGIHVESYMKFDSKLAELMSIRAKYSGFFELKLHKNFDYISLNKNILKASKKKCSKQQEVNLE